MASSQAFSVIPPSSRINTSAVLPPTVCLKTSLFSSLHRLASFRCACVLRKTLGGLLDSSSLKASSKFNFVDRSLGLRVESVAFVPAASPAKSSEMPQSHSDTFLTVNTEKELLSGIRKEVEMKRISPRVGYAMEELYWNYRRAVLEGGAPQDKIVQIMATVLDRILLQFEDPFVFPAYHEAIRDPYDYYMFGQNYIRPLLDFRNSYLGNVSTFDEIEGQLKQGENVVFLANHQTEADPAVMALLLETTHPYLSQSLTYIAGDRVVADPFCKPFSMGRNLLCVYSKKHINDEPELIDMKRKANARALKELTLLLSDTDPRMTSLFWKALFENMDTTLKFSSSFYPQTDGQSEEANSSVLNLLKCFVSEHKATWEHYLPLVEYAYNNTVHTLTCKAPFEIVEGGKKVPHILQTKDKIFEADKYVQNTDEAYKKIEKTWSKQKKVVDCHRRELVFSPGDWVLLRFEKAKLRKMKGKERKLGMHYYGPFKICDKISDVAHRLRYGSRGTSEVEELDEILVLEQILAHKDRKIRGKVARRDLGKFKNYSLMDAKWMEEAELVDSPQLLQLYLEAFQLLPTVT
ncbi:hypothetical protein L7F22_052265 [Adiantum nelumboides]|nr:hypothetical protein [Adiantum nelumboides]